jgi:molecular chaperone GrpE (heat shock protein)
VERHPLSGEWKERALARVAELLDSMPDMEEDTLETEGDLHAIFEKLVILTQEQKTFHRKTTQSLKTLETSLVGVPEAVAAFSPALGALEAKLEELKCDLNSVMNKPDSHELDDRWSLSMGMLGRLERVLLQMEHAPRTSLWLGTKAWTQAWVDVRKAIEILHHHVVEFMGVHGLERMKVMGCRFDPKTMVAVDHRPSAVAQEGTVIEELFPGFISAGRVIRPAEVMVSKGR